MAKFNLTKLLLISARYLLVMSALHGGNAYAQNSVSDKLDAYVSIGSSDIYRGVKRHDYDLAVQAAVRFEMIENLFVGAHLSPAEFFQGPNKTKKEVEFSHYLAWSFLVKEDFAMQLRFSRYTYPGSVDTFFEYDYNELLLSVEISNSMSLAVSVSDVGLAFASGYAYAQAGYTKSLPRGFELSAALGGVRSLNSFSSSYGYWDVGVSRPFGRVMSDLRYHDSPSERFWFGRALADKQWVLSLTMAW